MKTRRAGALTSRTAVATGVAAALMAAVLPRIGVLHDLLADVEAATLDYRMAVFRGARFPPGVTPRDPIIVAIDDASVTRLGRFPEWPRTLHAQLTDRLHAAGARAIAFDVLFPDSAPGTQDSVFASAIRRAGNVILASAPEGDGGTLEPVPLLRAAAAAVGDVRIEPDADGVVRRMAPRPGVRSFAAAVLAQASAARVRTPTQLLDVPGPPGTFLTLSYADVLAGSVPHAVLRDRIVLVGATAIGLGDNHATAFAAVTPGIELHAAAIENALDGRGIIRAGAAWGSLAPLLLALLVAFGFVLLHPLVAIALTLVLGGCHFLAAAILLEHTGVWLPVASPLLAAVIAAVGTSSVRFGQERKRRLELRSAFARYVAPELADELAHDPAWLTLGGVEREISVIFVDIRGFTAMAERLTAEALTDLLRAYFEAVTTAALARGALVDKYIGDAVMLVFGAPKPMPEHAARACDCALAILAAVEERRDRWATLAEGTFRVGIGVASGPAVVGNFGSEHRFDYTAIGDTVNLAARLEAECGTLGRDILVSGATRTAAGDGFLYETQGERSIRGKIGTTEVFALLGRRDLSAPAAAAAPPVTSGGSR